MLSLAGRTITPLVHPLTTTFIVVIFLVFMLIGREDLRDRGYKLAGAGRMHVTTTAMRDAAVRVGRYLQMQLLVNLSYGAVAGLALAFIGVPHPLLWAVLTCPSMLLSKSRFDSYAMVSVHPEGVSVMEPIRFELAV